MRRPGRNTSDAIGLRNHLPDRSPAFRPALARPLSPGTIKSYERALGQLRSWADCDDLTSISRLQATAFARHLGEQVGTVTGSA